MINKFKPSNFTLEDFEIGQTVNVHKKDDDSDLFNHDFTGTVHSIGTEFICVVDQEENYHDVEPCQLTYNSDEHMHD